MGHGAVHHEKMTKFDVFIDTDAFVGFYLPKDANRPAAKQGFLLLERENLQPLTTTWVVSETATVLSHKAGQSIAHQFLRITQSWSFPTLHVEEPILHKGYELFLGIDKKGMSMTDCVNAAICQELDIKTIFSFDEVYEKKFGMHYLT